ncbi:MAG: fatty acid--CoA ligase [Proteobacteria bacterium]|nr:MAG: fatty acid--CoA ligase [Pseudomonadota bacterium]
MPSYEQVVAQLTGPGAPFEIVTETVDGRPMKNWKNRERSMREKIRNIGLRGDQTCMVHGERRISYGELTRTVWGAAAALRDEHGLRSGDRVAILAMNSPDWLISLFGATAQGAVAVGMNGWWAPEEIEYGLTDSGSRFLVVDERLWPRVAGLAGKLPHLEKIFYVGASPPPGTVPFSELLVQSETEPAEPIDEGQPWVLLYTSGTTGRPKGCITTHRGTVSQVIGIVFASLAGALMGGSSPLAAGGGQPCNLLTTPLFHVGGLHSVVCTALTAGSKLVFLEGKFDPVKVMQTIERERVTIWGSVPTMLHRVVHHPDVAKHDLSSLVAVSFGAAPISRETLARAREVLPVKENFTNAYGLTETHGVATVNGGKDLMGRNSSIGRPLPILDMQIGDPQGRPVKDGELGEIQIYGPTVTPGYWNRPDATAETVVDGWLRTGDLGTRDEEGFFFIADRAKDMIIRGGENVYCTEIENVLADHPEIDEACVIGVPDAELGERVKAIVYRVPGSQLDADAVKRHVAARMAAFKVPELVEFTDKPLPRNPAGKLLKNVFRGTGAVPFQTDDLD